MSDLIDRQEAIDAFNTNLNGLVVGGEENAKTVENYLNGVIEKIKCLPSAEPEGYTCNDCYLSMQNCHDKSICCEDETGLCDYFEEIPSGADMRGEDEKIIKLP